MTDHLLQWKKFIISSVFSEEFLDNTNIEAKVIVEEEFNSLRLMLANSILTEHLETKEFVENCTTVEKVPSSTYQFFKMLHKDKWWAPRWFKDYHYNAVLNKKVHKLVIDTSLLFPNAGIPFKGNHGVVVRHYDYYWTNND